MGIDTPPTRPAPWFAEMVRLKPVRWSVWRSLRAGVAVGLPFAVGVLCDAIMTGMWIAMGTLLLAAGERAGSYRSIVRQIAIAAPIGALGYFAGHLVGLPWPTALGMIGLLGFAAGLVSSYGPVLSIGAMQALLVAAIAIGAPAIAPFWQPAALYLVGAALYCAILGVEAIVRRSSPLQEAGTSAIGALAVLAERRAESLATVGGAARAGAMEEARRNATDRLAALYGMLHEVAVRAGRRDAVADALAATFKGCDAAFAAILSSGDASELEAAGRRLRTIQKAFGSRPAAGMALPAPTDIALAHALDDLAAAAMPADARAGTPPPPAQRSLRRILVAPDGEAVRAALALSLCLVLAYACRVFVDGNHWFWIPLTVGLVMKPDLGSIFARAVLRCIGTLAGVIIGAAALAFLSKGFALVAAIAVLAALLPAAMMRSYALQAVVLTPLVLILIDIIVPGTGDVDYALQRLGDTLVGGAIVLVFGYFLWPRTHQGALAEAMRDAMGAVASYLRAAAVAGRATSDNERGAFWTVAAAQQDAYRRLSELRARLGRAMAEPGPAGREAFVWFPVIAAAERICDRVTAFVAAPDRGTGDDRTLEELARAIAAMPVAPAPGADPHTPAAELETGQAEGDLLQALRSELQHMSRLVRPAA